MKLSWEKINKNLNKLNNYVNLAEKKRKLLNSQQFDYRIKQFKSIYNYAEKENILKILPIILFIWGFTIVFYLILFSSITGFTDKISEEINLKKNTAFSLYKPGIDVISSLKNTDYINCIQRIYIHPEQKNRLMVLIKSNYWNILTSEKKEELLSKIMGKWKKIYKNSDSEKKLAPEVYFANI